MEGGAFTIGDLAIIGIVLLSALLAMVRGFTREVLGLGGIAAAAAASYFLYPKLTPMARQYIQPDEVADIATIIGIFLVVWIIAMLISSRISNAILDSAIGMIDRTLGFLFGAARGVLILSVLFIVFLKLIPDSSQHPEWLSSARFLPIIAEGAKMIEDALPEEAKEYVRQSPLGTPTNSLNDAAPDAGVGNGDSSGEQGYNLRDQNQLERVIRSVSEGVQNGQTNSSSSN